MATAAQNLDRDDSEDLVLTEIDAPVGMDPAASVSTFAESLARSYADRVPPQREGDLHWV
jgi:hypothetical protein